MGESQTCCGASCRREGSLTLWVAAFRVKVDMGRRGTAEFGSMLSEDAPECIKVDAGWYWGLAGATSGRGDSIGSTSDEKRSVTHL